MTVAFQYGGTAASSAAQLGSAMREARIECDMSQSALAVQTGRSRKWVSDVERGVGSAGVESVAQAADILGLDLRLFTKHPVRANGASLPGSFDRPNEDAWGAEGRLAWVIDGATQPDTTVQSVSASEYAHALSEAVRSRAGTVLPLSELLSDAIATAATWPQDEPGPAATVAMVRKTAVGIEWLVLGDAGIVLRPSAHAEAVLLSDNRLAHVATQERDIRRNARAQGASDAALKTLSKNLYSAELAARNTDGGYWVASADPLAAQHAITGACDIAGPAYLATDGVLDSVGTGHLWSNPEAALAAWSAMSPEEIVARAQWQSHARPDAKTDDATIVQLT